MMQGTTQNTSRPGAVQRALISAYDKTGIVEFALGLAELGVELVSTGGTARALRDAGLRVALVEELTGFPEMLDGRVKTLHPAVHAAILADRDNPEHVRQLRASGIAPIDMVVVDLYPFEPAAADPGRSAAGVIEMIDIGGPCLLRAAAKNHRHVLVVCDPRDYAVVLEGLRAGVAAPLDYRGYASKALARVSAYDACIAGYLGSGEADRSRSTPVPALERMGLRLGAPPRALRYGENPHQSAQWYDLGSGGGEARVQASFDQPEISFNNLGDAHAALELCKELTRAWPHQSAFVFIKHANPCGAAVAGDMFEAYRRAYLGDPQAAMGGVLAGNRIADASLAGAVMHSLDRWGRSAGAAAFFIELWLAPAFEPQAVEIIRTARPWGQRVRLLACGDPAAAPDPGQLDVRAITGGLLVQTRDLLGLNEGDWRAVTRRQPTAAELGDLRLAWLVCKHTCSNAVTLCRDGMLVGNGAGQMSRVMSCRAAAWSAANSGHQELLAGAVAASDGFFPFSDGPQILIDAGIKAIIQPGGSKHDADTIAACDASDVAMVLTATRHFKH